MGVGLECKALAGVLELCETSICLSDFDDLNFRSDLYACLRTQTSYSASNEPIDLVKQYVY